MLFPEYGANRVVIGGGFSANFHGWGELAVSLTWLTALTAAVAFVLRRLLTTRTSRRLC
jgi:hypothetical protein